MIVEEIRDRLAAETAGSFALVEGIAGLAAIADQPAATPAAYVFVKEEAAGPNQRATGGVLQVVEVDVAVVIVATNVSDAGGGAAAVDVDALKAEVTTALVGWQPASADDLLAYVGGQVVRARGGVVWFEAVFSTQTLLEA